MRELPFKMRQKTKMEKYRAETFWTKEPETLEWIASFDLHGIFFDVGANIGVYSLYAASLHNQIVYAFEPMPHNYWTLRANINLNKFTINAFQYAVGSRNGFCSLEIPKEAAGETGAQLSMTAGDTFCCRLDSLPVIPDYVKIDIDGQELEVIKGMEGILPYVTSILIEVSSTTKEEITGILSEAGFNIDSPLNSMTPHSRERREAEGIDAENIIFTR